MTTVHIKPESAMGFNFTETADKVANEIIAAAPKFTDPAVEHAEKVKQTATPTASPTSVAPSHTGSGSKAIASLVTPMLAILLAIPCAP